MSENRVKITTYGHAIAISCIGIWVTHWGDLWSFVGGTLIGMGLFLAKKSGMEEK